MPKLAYALAFVLALVATSGAFAPDVRAAETEPKVVIIVGATHNATSGLRTKADAAYAVAREYTSNVVKVYSPNATWSKVKSATAGASIVIYMGHGNGWPSPYPYDPEYKTRNGFGLNSSAGNGDHNNKYYGEPYVSTLDLAPNAVILLHHLCYASGNSEPGDGEPSVSVARQRIDNYGAGFLRTRARAVIAEGHSGPEPYLRGLFTTDQTIEELWRNQNNANGNVSSFASSRTPGATAFMDPKTSTSGFYRSLVGDPDLTTGEVRGGGDAYATAASSPASGVTDISSSKFYHDIVWLYESGLTSGCSPTRFCPNGTVTRGQMASFLARALNLPAATKDHFSDDNGTTHEKNINRIAEAGLTVGCGPGRFCPTREVSRGQMAAFLARALELPAATKDYFSDDNGTTHEKNINRIAQAGLTKGCGSGRYCPNNVVTRGQMAAFLHRSMAE